MKKTKLKQNHLPEIENTEEIERDLLCRSTRAQDD
jgi:hypothetical protein